MIDPINAIKRARNPHLALRSLNRRYHYIKTGTDYNSTGVDVLEQDWDNLILLDACRYDLFDQVNTITGRLERRESRGADTVEFLRGNLRGKILHDTVYVTASPMLHRNRDEIDVEFHDVVDIWNDGGWSEEEETVLPAAVTEAAMTVADRYPNKRLFVHYLQPHYPFVGAENRPFHEKDAFSTPGEYGSWTRMAMGELTTSKREIREAYRDNLEYVLESVQNLTTKVKGRTVITSDHGNLLGERAFPIPIREWGHPRGLHVSDLVTVPWLVIESDERREVLSESPDPDRETETEESEIKERLAQLGYVDAD